MSDPNDQLTAVPDAALLQRVQQFNQPRIVGKLLHDLRNPMHSLRIAVELFSRIANAGPDAGKLLEKAGRYAGPAQGAGVALAVQVDRIAMYLSPPLAPAIQPLAINAWLAQITALLRESTHGIETVVQSRAPDDLVAFADAPRLSHGVLHWALTRLHTCALHASVQADAVQIRIEGPPSKRALDGAVPDAEVLYLIERAGGVAGLNEGAMTIGLGRCS